MDIYVETNFVLEVALLQEQHESCEDILGLCEQNKARLIIPAYSLVEPYDTHIRKTSDRKKLSNDLGNILKQLARSKPYEEQNETFQEVIAILVRSQEDEKERLRNTLNRLLAMANIIPLTPETISSAINYQADYDLSPQDSVVFASVLQPLHDSTLGQKCFLNKNSKDFDDPDIVEKLNSYGCKMLARFDQGYRYIISQIRSGGSV